MAKFYGVVGYIETKETDPGVWEEFITERPYYGDIVQNRKRWETTDKANDNITISNKISIMADAYADEHFFAIRYVNWMGASWKVTDVEVERPRLILSLGGVYNDSGNYDRTEEVDATRSSDDDSGILERILSTS